MKRYKLDYENIYINGLCAGGHMRIYININPIFSVRHFQLACDSDNKAFIDYLLPKVRKEDTIILAKTSYLSKLIEYKDSHNICTLIEYAYFGGHSDTIKYLHGNMPATSKHLLYACISGNIGLVTSLIEQGIDLSNEIVQHIGQFSLNVFKEIENKVSCDNVKHAMLVACQHNNINVFRYLINKYLSLIDNISDYMLTSCNLGSFDIVKSILCYTKELDEYALTHACHSQRFDLVLYLISSFKLDVTKIDEILMDNSGLGVSHNIFKLLLANSSGLYKQYLDKLTGPYYGLRPQDNIKNIKYLNEIIEKSIIPQDIIGLIVQLSTQVTRVHIKRCSKSMYDIEMKAKRSTYWFVDIKISDIDLFLVGYYGEEEVMNAMTNIVPDDVYMKGLCRGGYIKLFTNLDAQWHDVYFKEACTGGDRLTICTLILKYKLDNDLIAKYICLSGDLGLVEVFRDIIEPSRAIYDGCRSGNESLAWYLINRSWSEPCDIYRAAISGALSGGNTKLAQDILRKAGHLDNLSDAAQTSGCLSTIELAESYYGYTTTVDIICLSGNIDTIKYFINKGCKVNPMSVYNACTSGNLEAVKLVCELAGFSRRIASKIATSNNYLHILRYLMPGASLSLLNELMFCNCQGIPNINILKYLTSLGANSHSKCIYKICSSIYWKDHKDVIKFFINYVNTDVLIQTFDHNRELVDFITNCTRSIE